MKIYKGLWGILAALALSLLWTTPAQAAARGKPTAGALMLEVNASQPMTSTIGGRWRAHV